MSSSRVLYITAFHPGGKGMIGAGEAISEDSLRVLCASGKDVHVLCLAPDNQSENFAVVELCHSYTVLRHSRLQACLGIFRGIFRGSLVAPWLFSRVSGRNIRAARDVVMRERIDEVRLDFPSTLGFASMLKSLPMEYFVHDVLTQKIGRKFVLSLLGAWVRTVERGLLIYVRRCIVMAQKDGDLLRRMGFSGEIELQQPTRVRVGEVDNARPVAQLLESFKNGQNLVFFGNMRRPENHWSLMYFLAFRFPQLRKACPDARLWVLGLAPRWSLKLLARYVGGVEVVGAVDDPVPAFRASSLCLVPLRYGAGVKIKVLQMLEAGATVVSTPVGAEGIAANPHLTVVNDAQLVPTICCLLEERSMASKETGPA
jgi:hypothetical protein